MILSEAALVKKIKPGRLLSGLVLLFFLGLYLIFPSGLSTTDGWNYAAEIKHAGEIFHPHHLLYNALGYIFCFLPAKTGIGTLECLKALNAVFAILVLFVVQLILRRFHKNEISVILVTCLAGFSFSVIRFATENETYIIPLFFALSASYNYLKFSLYTNQKYAFYSGLWITVSVLFHQIFIFWWLGILTGMILSKRIKPILWYILISLLAPLIYLVIIVNISGNLEWGTIISFISGDFSVNNAHLGMSLKGLFFSAVNLVRSFIQIHGYIFHLVGTKPFMIVPGIISAALVFLALTKLPVKKITPGASSFVLIHIIITVFQFVFALLAAGNAEFMVMIPVLVFVLLSLFLEDYKRLFSGVAAGMAIWNLSFGIIPLHFNPPLAEKFLCDAAIARNIMVIGSDDQQLKSMIYYKTGNNKVENIYKSPAVMRLKGSDSNMLESAIDSALARGSIIYTDCLGPGIISRASISEGNENERFFSKYKTAEIKSWNLLLGRKVVSRIEAKL